MSSDEEKLKKFFKEIQRNEDKKILPHDLIFAFFAQLDNGQLKGDSAGINWFFYNLKSEYPKLELIDKFFFSYTKGDPYPLCALVERTISSFGLSKNPILRRSNPVFNRWEIDDKDIEKFKKSFDKFSEETKNIILEKADKFNKYVIK